MEIILILKGKYINFFVKIKGKMKVTKYNIDHFKKLAEEKGGKCLSNEYINCKTKLEFQCDIGHIWKAEPAHIVRGTWCPRCGRQHLKYNIDFFKQFAENKSGKCLSEKYNNSRVKLKFQCDKGHEWEVIPHHLIEGHWCPKCGAQHSRKYTVDNSFFSKDTEESFYVAGFLMADGCLYSGQRSGYSINITLAIKDLNHLEKIKSALKSTSPINIKNAELNGKIHPQCSFNFNSEQCFKDLNDKFGIFPNKTYYTRLLENIANNPFIHHFLRGMIDGDGCFRIDKNEVRFDMYGTKEFLERMHQVFLDHGICDSKIKRRPLECKKGKQFFAFDNLKYGGNKIHSRMYDFLYKDATIFMDRKEQICRQSKILAYKKDK